MNGLRMSIVPVVVGCAALAGCGSTGAPSGTMTNGASAGPGGSDPALALARCMRAHGVPNFPDPNARAGGIEITPGSGINPQSPAFQAAQSVCKKYLPNKGQPTTMSASDRKKAFAFAQCMRTHGQPDFPDPRLGAPTGSTLVLALHGMAFAVGPGLNPRSPAFRQAAARCGINLPGLK